MAAKSGGVGKGWTGLPVARLPHDVRQGDLRVLAGAVVVPERRLVPLILACVERRPSPGRLSVQAVLPGNSERSGWCGGFFSRPDDKRLTPLPGRRDNRHKGSRTLKRGALERLGRVGSVGRVGCPGVCHSGNAMRRKNGLSPIGRPLLTGKLAFTHTSSAESTLKHPCRSPPCDTRNPNTIGGAHDNNND